MLRRNALRASLRLHALSCTQHELAVAQLPVLLLGIRQQVQRGFSSEPDFPLPTKHASLYVADLDESANLHTPVLLGLINYFERHIPYVGYFNSLACPPIPGDPDGLNRHTRLVHQAFNWRLDPRHMMGPQKEEATKLIAAGKTSELLDRVYGMYAAYQERHEMVIVEGTGVGGPDLDAQIASALGSPVVMVMGAGHRQTASDIFNQMMSRRNLFADHKVQVLGAIVDHVPRSDLAILTSQLRSKFGETDVAFLGAVPVDPLLESVRLDEVRAGLGADLILGNKDQLDQEFDNVIIACQRVEELLELLEERPDVRNLVVTSVDRVDIILALLASRLSVEAPTVAGVLLTPAGSSRNHRSYSNALIRRIFEGVARSGLYAGTLLPVMSTSLPLYGALQDLDNLSATILPSSNRKIQQAKLLFDSCIDANTLVVGLDRTHEMRMTPKMFTHNIKAKCLAKPQTIVLPEALDKRVLMAAAEVTVRGLAHIVLLGEVDLINAEAKKLGLDISKCKICDPKNSDRLDKYVDELVELRKKKGLQRDTAADLIVNDPNTFGVMMVHLGDADGMVSGAIHTTAATIRPAMQVLKVPNATTLVSSIFFMCLPDKVLVYGDCAVNVSPTSEELANIAATSADTAAAFGIEPRIAMLSYSTLGSGSGPDVQRVVDATKLVKELRPDLKVEGPIQYDAAIDPLVAAVKIKTPSEVAGKATVFVFPDLNTGNNTYKAVQQASGAIAMGPVMQGLSKPVNDLSRGCTVADIVNTVCVTSVQAIGAKERLATGL